MFSYNGEKHGLRRRINQKDYTRRLQEFFDHFFERRAGARMDAEGHSLFAAREGKRKVSGGG